MRTNPLPCFRSSASPRFLLWSAPVKLIFLHGPAAAGKFTVATELAALTGWELYHNHLVVDEVLKVHAFGTPGFVAARDRAWSDYFAHHPGPAKPGAIFTFNPENTVPQAFVDWLFSEMARRGVALHSVALDASEAVIEDRLASPQRQRFRKLTDIALYRELRARGAFTTPLIPRSDLRIDTGQIAPADAARRIRDFLRPAPGDDSALP